MLTKEQAQEKDTPARKPRWKATDRPVAKKTKKKAATKKSANKKNEIESKEVTE